MTERPKQKGSHISLVAAVSIGVGAMVGAGIFSIIGAWTTLVAAFAGSFVIE